MVDEVETQLRGFATRVAPPTAPPIGGVVGRGRFRHRVKAIATGAAALVVTATAFWGVGAVRALDNSPVTSEPGSGDVVRSGAPTSAPASTPPPGWTVHVNAVKQIQISTPDHWQVSWGYGDQYVVASNFPFSEGANFCTEESGIRATMPADSIFIWIFEPRDPWEFSRRPSSFTLDPRTKQLYEGMGCRPMYRFEFKDGDRGFVAHVAIGEEGGASARIATEVLNSFEALR